MYFIFFFNKDLTYQEIGTPFSSSVSIHKKRSALKGHIEWFGEKESVTTPLWNIWRAEAEYLLDISKK